MARERSSSSSSSGATAAQRVPAPVTPKGHATRAFILQSAAEVFAERGYAETTLSELIARSGLTKGAFYFHFASKEQLALAVLGEKQRQWLEFVRQQALDKPRAIDQLLARDLARIPGQAGPIRVQLRGWIDLVAGLISQAQRDGDLPAHLDAAAL